MFFKKFHQKMLIQFMFFKKAIKIWWNLPVDLTFTIVNFKNWEILLNFCDLLRKLELYFIRIALGLPDEKLDFFLFLFFDNILILTIVTNGTSSSSSKLRLSRRDNILFWPQLKSAQGFTLVTLLLWKKMGNLRICVVGKDIRVL